MPQRLLFLALFALLAVGGPFSWLGGGLATADDRVLLSAAPADRQTTQVKVVLEVVGQLQPAGSNPGTDKESPAAEKSEKDKADSSEPTSSAGVPLKAVGNLRYHERWFTIGPHQLAVRRYHQAEAKLNVDGQNNETRLRAERSTVVAQREPAQVAYWSPQGPLQRDELDVLQVPGASLLAHELLPGEPVAPGTSWQHEDALLAALLNLDAVTTNSVQSRLQEVDDQLARIEISGQLIGSANGAVTDLEVTGKYNFDRQQRRITWLAMAVKERREAGPAAPGFEVTARLRMLIEPTDCPDELSDTALAALDLHRNDPGRRLLQLRHEKPGFQLLHDRLWYLMSDEGASRVLQRIDGGEIIAQWNVRGLPSQRTRPPLTLEKYQREITEALGNSLQQIVDSEQFTTAEGAQVLRVTAVGQVGRLPIQWIYYHATGPDGQALSYVFTMEAEKVERFGAADIAITDSLKFEPAEEQEKLPVAQRAVSTR